LSELELIKQINNLQRQVDGLIKPEVGRWITWTPTVTQGVAITIAITYARYIIKDQTVTMMAQIELQSAGTPGAAVVVAGIPSIAAPANLGTIGTALVVDSGVQNYHGLVWAQTINDFRIITNGGTGFFGVNPAYTIANGDRLEFVATYEQT